MISVIQRVSWAQVTVGGKLVGRIERGLAVLTAVHATDTETDINKTAEKLLGLRVFPQGEKHYDLDATQVGGGLLVISNFTVAADLTGGRRPALHPAASPAVARGMFDQLLAMLRGKYPNIATGEFGAEMSVELANDGPLTVIFNTQA